MRTTWRAVGLGVLLTSTSAVPALAQRVAFERSFDVSNDAVLDVSTIRGRINVSAGEPGRIMVRGTATVRVGLTVPADAYAIAKSMAANPPVQQDKNTIRLRPPMEEEQRRAVTISYEVIVPRAIRVNIASDSGAITIRDVSGAVLVQTQSSAIDLRDLGGAADVATQSGAVNAWGVAGDMKVSTGSSPITLRGLGAGLRARTQSGAIGATFRGRGDVDVETGSSAINLDGVNGGLTVRSNTGRIRVSGVPSSAWRVIDGSGRVDLAIERSARFTLGATSDSSTVAVEGFMLDGKTAKGLAEGKVGGGGPLVQAATRNGAIRVRAGI
jgi:DUF4097 and DUF4098 domain-containing protein YvlB